MRAPLPLEDDLLRLEQLGNDDAQLIKEFGAMAYPTEELYRLLQILEEQKLILTRWHTWLFILGGSAAFWMVAALVAAALDYQILSLCLLAATPFFLLLAATGHFLMRKHYPNAQDTLLISQIIQQELEKRGMDNHAF